LFGAYASDRPGPQGRGWDATRRDTCRPEAIEHAWLRHVGNARCSAGGYIERLLALKAASPKDPIKRAFFNKLLPGAGHAKIRWGTPIAVLLAQGALESHYGKVAPGNEYFGIKGKAPDGKSQMLATHEQIKGKLVVETDAFRAYASVEAACDDYGRFLRTNHRYAGAFAFSDDPLKFLKAICVAGYASLGGYYPMAASIIQFNGLADYDAVKIVPSTVYMDAVSIGNNLG
jgi:flagellar protein FlgJ